MSLKSLPSNACLLISYMEFGRMIFASLLLQNIANSITVISSRDSSFESKSIYVNCPISKKYKLFLAYVYTFSKSSCKIESMITSWDKNFSISVISFLYYFISSAAKLLPQLLCFSIYIEYNIFWNIIYFIFFNRTC